MLQFKIIPYRYGFIIFYKKSGFFSFLRGWKLRTDHSGYLKEFEEYLDCALEMNHIEAEHHNKRLTK